MILLCNVQSYLKIAACVYIYLYMFVWTRKKKIWKDRGYLWELKLEIRRDFQFLIYTISQKVEVLGLWVTFISFFAPLQYSSKFHIMNLCCFDWGSFLPGKQHGVCSSSTICRSWSEAYGCAGQHTWIHMSTLLLCSGWRDDFTSLCHSLYPMRLLGGFSETLCAESVVRI